MLNRAEQEWPEDMLIRIADGIQEVERDMLDDSIPRSIITDVIRQVLSEGYKCQQWPKCDCIVQGSRKDCV